MSQYMLPTCIEIWLFSYKLYEFYFSHVAEGSILLFVIRHFFTDGVICYTYVISMKQLGGFL